MDQRLLDVRFFRVGALSMVALFTLIAIVGIFSESGPAGEAEYLTARVQRGDIGSFVSATGTVTPVGQVNVGSQLSGEIAEVFVDFNDRVRPGQSLARIDPQGFEAIVREAEAGLEIAEANMLVQEAALSKAKADLATARASQAVRAAETESKRAQRKEAERQLERARRLGREAAISGSDIDRAQARAESTSALFRAAESEVLVGDATIQGAEAAVQMASANLQNAFAEVKRRRAALEQARVNLERTTIRSPIDGVVINRNIERGQTVAASLEAPTLFTLASDLKQMEVQAQIDQADIGRIALGQSVTFTIDAYPDRVFSGTVTQIRKAPQVVQNVVTYVVIISADNSELLLLPGMTAILRIVVTQIDDILKIPNAALRFRPTDEIAEAAEIQASAGALGKPAHGMPTLIWILEDGEITPRLIGYELGDANVAAVVSGKLKAGERVVIGTTMPTASPVGVRLDQ